MNTAETRLPLHDDDPVRWPEGASTILEIPAPTLKARRETGDHPKLYAVGRAIFTTRRDLREWVLSKEVPTGFKARPPSIRRGEATA